jgi:tRNA threonylcarbamoyladenosine biosynthesis protein TsaE
MKIRDEAAMIRYGTQLGARLTPPATIELVGDVGAGKTTLVKGLAAALGIDEPVTSPSFVINKKYHGMYNTVLSHYDFYRLPDPGLMADELAESIHDPATITVIEWSATVAHLLPDGHLQITVTYNDDGTRTVRESR